MKKLSLSLVLGVMVLGICATAFAGTGAILRVNVPFAFYSDREMLPAGDYVFEIHALTPAAATASSVLIRNNSGTVAKWILTRPAAAESWADSHLHFNRYGDRYFLARVESSGLQATVSKTKIEREYRAATKLRPTTIIAGK